MATEHIFPAVNPDYPYLQCEIRVRLREARTLIRVAKQEHKENHPAVAVARQNIAILERMKENNNEHSC